MRSDELQTLWQGQPVKGETSGLEQIRQKSSGLYACVRARNIRETFAGAIAIALLTWFMFGKTSGLQRVSFLLLIAGMVYVLVHMWRRGRASELPAELGALDAI